MVLELEELSIGFLGDEDEELVLGVTGEDLDG